MKPKKSIRKWLIPEAPRPGQWKRWILARLAVFFVTFSVLFLGGGLIFKNRLIFHPTAEAIDFPANYGLKVDEFWLELDSGLKIRAWLAPAVSKAAQKKQGPPMSNDNGPTTLGDWQSSDPPAPGKIALVLQGNSGNISMMTSRLVILQSLGLTVLTVDYPGYGPNQGRPSEAGVYQSAEAAWQWAAQQGYRPEDILIYGYSLGGGVASYLADRHPPAAVVLDSTFTRLRDVPAYWLPWLSPYFYFILGDAFDTETRLSRIKCPLLILHSPDDAIVPYALGEKLLRTYQNNYKDLATGSGGHTDFYLNSHLYRDKIRDLLAAAWPEGTNPETF